MPNMIDNGRGFPAKDMTPYLRRISGSFRPNGSSAVNNALNNGDSGLWTVARSSQGLFLVTLRDAFTSFEAITHGLQLAAAAARWTQLGNLSQGNRTFELRTVDGSGAVQDIASDSNNLVHFICVVRCSTLKA